MLFQKRIGKRKKIGEEIDERIRLGSIRDEK